MCRLGGKATKYRDGPGKPLAAATLPRLQRDKTTDQLRREGTRWLPAASECRAGAQKFGFRKSGTIYPSLGFFLHFDCTPSGLLIHSVLASLFMTEEPLKKGGSFSCVDLVFASASPVLQGRVSEPSLLKGRPSLN